MYDKFLELANKFFAEHKVISNKHFDPTKNAVESLVFQELHEKSVEQLFAGLVLIYLFCLRHWSGDKAIQTTFGLSNLNFELYLETQKTERYIVETMFPYKITAPKIQVHPNHFLERVGPGKYTLEEQHDVADYTSTGVGFLVNQRQSFTVAYFQLFK